ncbi:MAG: DUF2795 domain-containing protein [Acidimicrobiales bacterium]|nr:DUF2795 domain-containing protein [Acidimicrobiales bacterium]
MDGAGADRTPTGELATWLPPQAFPASGEILADEIRDRGGPRRLIVALRRLPVGRVYQSVGQLARALHNRRRVQITARPGGAGTAGT